MLPRKENRIIVILGPTASGKSDLAVKIAQYIEEHKKNLNVSGAEIMSADSRQVYKGMDIGTGKITKREMRGISHHMLDVASPKKIFTVADYQKKGIKIIKTLFKKNIVPIVCGGTGFYIDALIYETKLPDVPPNRLLRKKLSKKTAEELFAILKNIDSKRAENIDGKNPMRLIRAIEIAQALGKVPALKKKEVKNTLFLGLSPRKDILYEKIHIRLAKRMRTGMIREVKNLHAEGISWKKLDQFGLEYRYISRFLRGTLTREEMTEELEKEIRNYTKRQITWFKKNKDITWIKKNDAALRAVKKFLS